MWQWSDTLKLGKGSDYSMPGASADYELSKNPKPFGAAEVGPNKRSLGTCDYSKLIAAIKDRYPRTAFFQVWGWGFSLEYNRNR